MKLDLLRDPRQNKVDSSTWNTDDSQVEVD